MNERRASSLIELLIIMSACSVVLTLSAALLHRTMHIHSRSRAYVDTERNATRLSQQFREDVRRAVAHRTGAAADDEQALLQLTFPGDDVVQYAVVGGTVSRNLLREGRIVSREAYAFPANLNVEVQQQDAPSRLVLTIATEPADVRNRSDKERMEACLSPVSLQAEAVLEGDMRFLLRSDEEEVQR